MTQNTGTFTKIDDDWVIKIKLPAKAGDTVPVRLRGGRVEMRETDPQSFYAGDGDDEGFVFLFPKPTPRKAPAVRTVPARTLAPQSTLAARVHRALSRLSDSDRNDILDDRRLPSIEELSTLPADHLRWILDQTH